MNWFKSSKKRESEDYEKEYLTRYKKEQKPDSKKKVSKQKKSIETDKKNQDDKVKTRNEEQEPLSAKFESVKQEYNIIIKNLMDAKRELKNLKESIQKSNDEQQQ